MGTMKRSSLLLAAAAGLAIFGSGFAVAQNTERPRDIVVVLDVSGSMNQGGVMTEVAAYLEKELLRGLVKIGDSFSIILFGETSRPLLSRSILSQGDIDAVSRELSLLSADDDFTDMGTALESLEAALASRADGTMTPVALFITDGKNAPPPDSPYADKDISVDERFLNIGKRIAMKGWRLYVIGLGEDTDAAAVAASVEGSTLVPPSQALNPKGLEAYVTETESAAASMAAGFASGAAGSSENAAASDGGAEGADAGKIGSFPTVPLIAAGAAAAILVILAVAKRRSKKKEN